MRWRFRGPSSVGCGQGGVVPDETDQPQQQQQQQQQPQRQQQQQRQQQPRRQVVAEVILRPSVVLVGDGDDDGIRRKTATLQRAIALKAASLGDFAGPRAAKVVLSSITSSSWVQRVTLVAFDMLRSRYVVHAVCDSLADLRLELRDVYGDLAADTWGEGDVAISPRCELELALVSVHALM
jgi:hypothetical protein